MNPLTNIKNINKLNEIELSKGLVDKKSWHDLYKESAWIFIGGLPFDLTEGDILSVFSQYGEIVNINYVRDKKTGKPKGFCFLCYANQKSTILAVDNLNGIKIVGRTIRVDHVANYKPPKDYDDDDEMTKTLKSEGCAPKPIKLESPDEKQKSIHKKEKKKHKKDKKKKKKSHSKEKGQETEMEIKVEKSDPGYSKYEHAQSSSIIEHHKRKKQSSDSEGSSESISHLPREDSPERISYKSFRNSNHSNIRSVNNDNDIHSREHTESSFKSKKRDKEHRQKDYKRNQDCESYKQDAYSKHKLKEPSSFSNPDQDKYKNTNRDRYSDSSSDKEHHRKQSQSKDSMRLHKRHRHDSSSSDDSEHHRTSKSHSRQYHKDNDSQYEKTEHSKKSSYSKNHSRDKYKGNR